MGYATGYDMSHLNPESDEMSNDYLGNFGRRSSSKSLEYVQIALGSQAKQAWEDFEQQVSIPNEYANERLMELYTDYEKTGDENLLNMAVDLINGRRNYVYEFVKAKSEKDPLSYTRAARYVNSLEKTAADEGIVELFDELREIAKTDLTAWGNILIKASKGGGKTQWAIPSAWVREQARRIGTLDFGDDWLSDSVDKYSEILRDKFVPVYEELANITGFINEYYLEGKVESGLKAADSARQFDQKARNLIGPKQLEMFENNEE